MKQSQFRFGQKYEKFEKETKCRNRLFKGGRDYNINRFIL